jgi:hypothetical protein
MVATMLCGMPLVVRNPLQIARNLAALEAHRNCGHTRGTPGGRWGYFWRPPINVTAALVTERHGHPHFQRAKRMLDRLAAFIGSNVDRRQSDEHRIPPIEANGDHAPVDCSLNVPKLWFLDNSAKLFGDFGQKLLSAHGTIFLPGITFLGSQ